MNDQDNQRAAFEALLPDEFKSGNSVEVERATFTRSRMLEVIQGAIAHDRQQRGEPVKLIHMAVIDEGELRMMSGRRPVDCELYAMPDLGVAPDLYLAPQPAAPAQEVSVIIDFDQVGSVGPLPVVNDRVSVPVETVDNLVRMVQPATRAEPPKLDIGVIDFQWREIQRLDDSYRMFPHQELANWAYNKGFKAAPVAGQPSVLENCLSLDEDDVSFIAARLRRLCSKFNYSLGHKDDSFIVAVAGSIIGGILTNLELAERNAAPADGQAQQDADTVGSQTMTAKERFDAAFGDSETDPVERLRFFCSIAMSGQDWLDVEPFFDELTKEQPDPAIESLDLLTQSMEQHADKVDTQPLTRQDIFDRFAFLEGLVNEHNYRKIAETAISIYEQAQPASGEDASLLSWLETVLFERKWNGVIDSGIRYQWQLRGDWRHVIQRMGGATLRDAIQSAMQKEGE